MGELKNLHAPQMTVTYADADANIGFIAAGRVPVRKPENNLKGLVEACEFLPTLMTRGTQKLTREQLQRFLDPRRGETRRRSQPAATQTIGRRASG